MTTISSGVVFGGGVILSPVAQPGVIQTGLILNLQTAPTSGTIWPDATGNKNTTIANAGANVSYVDSYGGGVRITNKTNGPYFDTGIIANTFANTFTISMTVAFDQTTAYWATWWGAEAYSNTQGYFAYQANSTSLTVGRGGAGGSTSAFSTISANIANVNVWDFTISGTDLRVYLNGNSKVSTTITAPSSFFAGNLFFAARHPNDGTNRGNDNAPGTYYSMRVYNRALSNVEVATNYTTLKQIHGLP